MESLFFMAIGMFLAGYTIWGMMNRSMGATIILTIVASSVYFIPLLPEIAGIASIVALAIAIYTYAPPKKILPG